VRHKYGCRAPYPGVPDNYEDVQEAMKYTEQGDIRTDADNYREQIQVGENAYLAASSPPSLASDSESDSSESLPLPIFEERVIAAARSDNSKKCGNNTAPEADTTCERDLGNIPVAPDSTNGVPRMENTRRRMIVPPPVDRTITDEAILADLEEGSCADFSCSSIFPFTKGEAGDKNQTAEGGEEEKEEEEEGESAPRFIRREDGNAPKAWGNVPILETTRDELRPFSPPRSMRSEDDEKDENEDGRRPGSLAHRCPELLQFP